MKKIILPIIPVFSLFEQKGVASARIDGILFYILEYILSVSDNTLTICIIFAAIIIISYSILRWYRMEG